MIDAGYRGEVQIVMTNLGASRRIEGRGEDCADDSGAGANGSVEQVEALEESARLGKGFGSSGR